MNAFTESAAAALAWLQSLGWSIKLGPEIVPGELAAEWTDYKKVVLRNFYADAPIKSGTTSDTRA